MDIGTRFVSYKERPTSSFSKRPPGCVLLSRQRGFYTVSRRESFDLGMLGVTSTRFIRSFNAARILGVHFRVDEWGRKTCGSVVTTIYCGRSRYCIVKRFLQVEGKCYASVSWLSRPEYPYNPIRVMVKVRMLSALESSNHPCVIPVDKIEPCSVAVLPDADGVHYCMLRTKGSDRVNVRY